MPDDTIARTSDLAVVWLAAVLLCGGRRRCTERSPTADNLVPLQARVAIMINWIKRELVVTGELSVDESSKLEDDWHRAFPNPNVRPWFTDYVQRKRTATKVKEAIDRASAGAAALLRTPNLDLILDEIREQKVVLFVGAGFSLSEEMRERGTSPLTGATVREALLRRLAPEDPESFAGLALEEIAEHYERRCGRDLLNQLIQRLCFERLPTAPLEHHRTLATLRCFRFMVTANWDRLIEKAFTLADPGRDETDDAPRLHVISRGDQIRDLNFRRATLLKLHGDYDDVQCSWNVPPRIASADLRNLEYDEPAVFSLLQALVLTHRIVLIGFHPSDYTLNRLLQHSLLATRGTSQAARPIVVVDPHGTAHLSARFQQPLAVQTTAERFLDVVKAFIDNDGRAVGHAFRKREGGKSPQHVWAAETCELAKRVLDRFPTLVRVEVVGRPLPSEERHDTKAVVAKRAGIILQDCIPKENGRLAMSCGTTLYRMVELIDPYRSSFTKLRVSSTTIPLSDDSDITSPFGLVTIMAHRLRGSDITGRAYQLPAGFADSVIAARWRSIFPNVDSPVASISGESAQLAGAKQYLRDAEDSHVFCLGVGSMQEHTTALVGYGHACLRACRSPADEGDPQGESDVVQHYLRTVARKQQIVGETMYRFFRRSAHPFAGANGMFFTEEEVASCLSDLAKDQPPLRARLAEFVLRLFHQVMTIDIGALLRASSDPARTVMLVAAGRNKATAMQALLQGGVGNVVVVDQELAHALATQPERPRPSPSRGPSALFSR